MYYFICSLTVNICWTVFGKIEMDQQNIYFNEFNYALPKWVTEKMFIAFLIQMNKVAHK